MIKISINMMRPRIRNRRKENLVGLNTKYYVRVNLAEGMSQMFYVSSHGFRPMVFSIPWYCPKVLIVMNPIKGL